MTRAMGDKRQSQNDDYCFSNFCQTRVGANTVGSFVVILSKISFYVVALSALFLPIYLMYAVIFDLMLSAQASIRVDITQIMFEF